MLIHVDTSWYHLYTPWYLYLNCYITLSLYHYMAMLKLFAAYRAQGTRSSRGGGGELNINHKNYIYAKCTWLIFFWKVDHIRNHSKCTICQTKNCNHFILCLKTKIRKFVIKNHYKRWNNLVWGVTYSKIFLLLYFAFHDLQTPISIFIEYFTFFYIFYTDMLRIQESENCKQ